MSSLSGPSPCPKKPLSILIAVGLLKHLVSAGTCCPAAERHIDVARAVVTYVRASCMRRQIGSALANFSAEPVTASSALPYDDN
eukprot:1026120-Prymnesium_polylepis.1